MVGGSEKGLGARPSCKGKRPRLDVSLLAIMLLEKRWGIPEILQKKDKIQALFDINPSMTRSKACTLVSRNLYWRLTPQPLESESLGKFF